MCSSLLTGLSKACSDVQWLVIVLIACLVNYVLPFEMAWSCICLCQFVYSYVLVKNLTLTNIVSSPMMEYVLDTNKPSWLVSGLPFCSSVQLLNKFNKY